MVFPRQVLAGHGVLEKTGELLSELGIKGRVLAVTGPNTFSIAAERVCRIIESEGIRPFTEVTGKANVRNVARALKKGREARANAVIGIGGGSKIDIAKAVALRMGIPFVSIPTSASHDGISSPRASIKGTSSSHSLDMTMPIAIIADTEVIARAPYRMLAAGCADVLSNATALLDWRLAARRGMDSLSTTAVALSRYAFEEIKQNAARIRKYDETAVWLAVRPIIASGLAMGVAGSSRPASGSEHLFSHAIDSMGKGNAMHGEQCGVGAIMMMHLHGGNWKGLREALVRLGCPVTAEELGLSHSDVVRALLLAWKMGKERYTILSETAMTPSMARRLAGDTGVI